MPPAVAGAAIAGAAGLGGAIIGHKGNKAALKSQEAARREAMAYQKEQDAKAEAAAKAREALYERQMNEWGRTQDALLKRYGINRTRPAFSLQGGPPAMSGVPGMAPGIPGVSNRGPMRLRTAGLAPQMQQLVNPYDLGGWADA